MDNQSRELEIRSRELQLKAQEDDHSFAHAGKALEAQERDRKDQRQSEIRAAKHRYWFVAGIILIAVAFLAVLAFMNKDQMALEVIKMVAYLGAGAIGGFFMGKNSGVKENNKSHDDEDE